jgi:uncharacterized protein (TIGR03435 family)
MTQFAAMLQRAVLARPVLDKTGLTGKYDFDLEWTPDDSQFGGVMPPIKPDNSGSRIFLRLCSSLASSWNPEKARCQLL